MNNTTQNTMRRLGWLDESLTSRRAELYPFV